MKTINLDVCKKEKNFQAEVISFLCEQCVFGTLGNTFVLPSDQDGFFYPLLVYSFLLCILYTLK